MVLLSGQTWLLTTALLLALRSGATQEADFEESSCHTFNSITDQMVHVDCSNLGLIQLPDYIDSEVEVLDLSENLFESIPAGLRNFKQLKTLTLSGNYLISPLSSEISFLLNLKVLNVSNNKLKFWENYGISSTLTKLDLSKNSISNIAPDSFKQMYSLTVVDLSENNIEQLSDSLFNDTKNLQVLILSKNSFSDVPKFKSTSLRYLDLSMCQITTFDKNDFETKPNLFEIDLSKNQIEYIPDNQSSPKLHHLDLSYNEINSINDYTFRGLPNLEVLSLSGNHFEKIWKTSYFTFNPNLKEMHLTGNRWDCGGFSIDLLVMYHFFTKYPPKISDFNTLICYEPQNVSGMTWQTAYIKTWHLDEDTNSKTTLTAVLAGVIAGIILTACVCKALLLIKKKSSRNQTPVTSNEENLSRTNHPETGIEDEQVDLRIRLSDDLPPSYAEALLMPRLNESFHSLPDQIEETTQRGNLDRRRSRSSGYLSDAPTPRRSTRLSARRNQDTIVL